MEHLQKYIRGIVTPYLVNLRDMFARRSISEIKVGNTTLVAKKKEETVTFTSSGSIILTIDQNNNKLNIHNEPLYAGQNVTIEDNYITVNDASLTTKGIVQLSNSITSTSQTTAATSKAVNDINNKFSVVTTNTYTNLPIGFMALMPFTSTELTTSCPGWYTMNGAGLDKTSTTASIKLAATNLEKLPAAFKTRWGITTNGNIVYLPNWFKTGMNGNLAPFMRPVNNNAKIGVYSIDTAINLTGRISTGARYNRESLNPTGVFTYAYTGDQDGDTDGSGGKVFNFNAQNQWGSHVGNEFAPRSIGMLPCIFLGS